MSLKVKEVWDYIQSLFDLDGDCWLGALTGTVIARFLLVHSGWPAITNAEALAYGAAIGAFAYSNKGGPKAS